MPDPATAAPGHSLTELHEVIDVEVDRFLQDGPTEAEMERGLAQAEAHFMGRLQTLGGFGGKSDQLNAYAVFLNNPGYLASDLERYRRATPAALLETAQHVLGNGGESSSASCVLRVDWPSPVACGGGVVTGPIAPGY